MFQYRIRTKLSTATMFATFQAFFLEVRPFCYSRTFFFYEYGTFKFPLFPEAVVTHKVSSFSLLIFFFFVFLFGQGIRVKIQNPKFRKKLVFLVFSPGWRKLVFPAKTSTVDGHSHLFRVFRGWGQCLIQESRFEIFFGAADPG